MSEPEAEVAGQPLTEEEQLLQDAQTLDTAYHRLQEYLTLPSTSQESSFVQRLRQRQGTEQAQQPKVDFRTHDQPHRTLLTQVEAVISNIRIDAAPLAVPVVLLSPDEWVALARISVHSGDIEGAELALKLMQRTDVKIPEASLEQVLKVYADTGRVADAERVLNTFVTGITTERQKHLHIRAHLRAAPPRTIAKGALNALHAYEAKNDLPALKTYTSVVTSLLSVPTPTAHAHGWDLYAHTRYVAHPKPDIFLYTTMMRACASPYFSNRASDPERALDLWTEMCEDQKIKPNVAAYNAVILACARSGTKMYVDEAFRLAREMLEGHSNAKGHPTMIPDQHTFYALLEGAKRRGDLDRTRWLLAQISRAMAEMPFTKVHIDEEIMLHTMHAYAAYDPPFKRSLARMTEATDAENAEADFIAGKGKANASVPGAVRSFSHISPQSRAEALTEAEALFERCITESAIADGADVDNTRSFGNVQMSSRLVNAYLSVHYKHGSLRKARTLWHELYERLGVEKGPRAYREALERCSHAKKSEREDALEFGREIFAAFQDLQAKQTVDARTIEKVHAAFIRLLALTQNIDESVEQLRAFVKAYPPRDVRQHNDKPVMRSMRTSLYAPRPLVRMSTTSSVPDGDVPPMLMFRDLDVLHHRLVAKEDVKRIDYVKWVCSAYEWALRVRRDNAFKAKPKTENGEVVEELPEEEGESQEWF
ncbi:hypothetical protein CYLTODRAFT_356765 [Cylindrobasidium torrendii FP15055 ss-10]|uniref:Pentacotripeptide-repeat region of PRORP domain-containing protein n=1 Tax=Cylindrobasidium torrendii FP15055 ss-10 TaxID=1314674 RepID=A0A0D7B5L4_9AGAR|nr:hypothetical protein CYLTODRAFT_356765 [Cylindrobasidium torrendii FP15055 ss-10]